MSRYDTDFTMSGLFCVFKFDGIDLKSCQDRILNYLVRGHDLYSGTSSNKKNPENRVYATYIIVYYNSNLEKKVVTPVILQETPQRSQCSAMNVLHRLFHIQLRFLKNSVESLLVL